MMINVSRIRGFLLQLPKPVRIRVTSADGDPVEVKPGRSAARTADSIAALGVDLIECLDNEGNVLRALRLGDTESQRSEAAEVPAGIQADPQALMLSHFANLIHRAYEHSTEIAFMRLVELAERLSAHSESIEARLAQTEAALRRAQSDQIQDALDRAQELQDQKGAGVGGDDDALMKGMVEAFMSSKAAAPSKPTNGAHTTKGKS